MNKIGISTLHSYRGSQIFEIVGFNSQFVEKYFPYTGAFNKIQVFSIPFFLWNHFLL